MPSHLLYRVASQHLHKVFGKKNQKLISIRGLEKRAREYRNAWKKKGDIILNGICKVFGLQFRKNIIDVYIAPWFSPISDPLVISPRPSPGMFMDILSHELMHVLLTDNAKMKENELDTLRAKWKKLFGNHPFVTLIHIPVHAGMTVLYLNILNQPERLTTIIQQNKNDREYKRAWDYVEKHGYKTILKKLRDG